MKLKSLLFLVGAMALFTSCIGDDIIEDTVEPEVRISNPVDSIEVSTSYTFEALVFNNTGLRVFQPDLKWTSLDTSILTIDSLSGEAQAKSIGTTRIQAEVEQNGLIFSDESIVSVGNTTVVQNIERTGALRTTSTYALQGDFTLKEENGQLELSFASNYRASTSLPGLYVYLTNNPNTTSNALEIGRVTSFNGTHNYVLPAGTGLNDYQYVLYFCKPFNVKVGDGEFDN